MLLILVPPLSILLQPLSPLFFLGLKKYGACRTLPRAYIMLLIFSLCSCSLLLWLQMINLFIVGGVLAKTEEIGKLCKIFDTVCALLIFNGSIYKSL